MPVLKNITEFIGHTPLIELAGTEKKFGLKTRLLAKVEGLNPGGSVKDRIAYAMIKDALDSGKISKSTRIIEPTSGNTGIGLALIGAAFGLKVTLVLPETMSVERRNILRAYGAELVLTEGAKGMKGAIAKAEELHAADPDSYIPQQFENPSNVKIHYLTTGPEIWKDTEGSVDIFVAGVGTGGTISGAGKYLKEQKPSVRNVAVEAASSPVLSGGAPGTHKIQGISAGFVPKNFDRSVVDEIIQISDDDAFSTGRLITTTEGIFTGISAGAAVKAALKLAHRPENAGKTIVVLLPDNGDRYLSTPLYKVD